MAVFAEHSRYAGGIAPAAKRLGGYGHATGDVEPGAEAPSVDCPGRTRLAEHHSQVDRGDDNDALDRQRAGTRDAKHGAARRPLWPPRRHHLLASRYQNDLG